MFQRQTLTVFPLILVAVLAAGAIARAQEAAIGATALTTPAIADDRSGTGPVPAVSSSPPPQFSPMTRSERLRNYMANVFSYEAILRSAAGAGIRQASGTPKEWGGGAEAYGERVGSGYAQHFIDRTLQYGISSLLHEDNRYFVSGQTGFLRRTKYAIKSTLMARHDNGNQYVSVSRIGGAAGGAFISREWDPRSINSAGDGAVSFGITMGTEMGFNVFREFWPDMKRHLRKK
jgi:hypothetical protein